MVSNLIVTQEGVVTGAYLDTTLLAMLASLIVPLVVSLITKQTASDGVRSIVNIVATAIMAVLALWINPSDVPVTWQLVVNTLVLSLISSFSAYKALWKPTGVAGSITAKTANFGIGSPPTMQTENKGAEEVAQVDEESHNTDDSAPGNDTQEDIGTFNPGEGEDDSDLDAEIDELPEVGPMDPNEEPVLDELTEAERNG